MIAWKNKFLHNYAIYLEASRMFFNQFILKKKKKKIKIKINFKIKKKK